MESEPEEEEERDDEAAISTYGERGRDRGKLTQ